MKYQIPKVIFKSCLSVRRINTLKEIFNVMLNSVEKLQNVNVEIKGIGIEMIFGTPRAVKTNINY